MARKVRQSLLEKAAAAAKAAASVPDGLVVPVPPIVEARVAQKGAVARLPGGRSVPLFGVSENPELVEKARVARVEAERAERMQELDDGAWLSKDEAAQLGWDGGGEVSRADISWVAANLKVKCRVEDAPSGIAWSLRAWAMQEPDKFYANVFGKVLPKEDVAAERDRANRGGYRTQAELLDKLAGYVGVEQEKSA